MAASTAGPMTVNPPLPSGSQGESAPETARAQPIGMLLRRTRDQRRLSIADAAKALRIRTDYLDAIEKGAYERLPGRAYAVGFVRSYADYLGLDAPEDLTLPVPIADRSIPGGRVLIAALVLAVCGYGFWYYLGTARNDRADSVADVPPALENEAAAPSAAKAATREPLSLPLPPTVEIPGAPAATAPASAQPAAS